MSSRPAATTHGVLLVDKPAGWSSFDVVRYVKPLFRPAKVGHTGTLDPLATGLLPLVIGQATKLVRFLASERKTYRAVLTLGTATDTLDAEGQPVASKPVPALSAGDCRRVLASFQGSIEQVPPRYSALRRDGKRFYELARAGIDAEPPARQVVIENMRLLKLHLPRLEFEVSCGAGTYVRSLAADIATALGTVGHLSSLVRLETDGWSLEQAQSVPNLDRHNLAGALLPLDQVLARFPRYQLSSRQAIQLAHGRALDAGQLEALLSGHPPPSNPVWFRSPGGDLHVLASIDGEPDTGRLAMKFERTLKLIEKR